MFAHWQHFAKLLGPTQTMQALALVACYDHAV